MPRTLYLYSVDKGVNDDRCTEYGVRSTREYRVEDEHGLRVEPASHFVMVNDLLGTGGRG